MWKLGFSYVLKYWGMSSTPDLEKDNWYRFGEPDSEGDEIVFDPDVDETTEDDYSDGRFCL